MKYVIDTYAWVEYFIGSGKGQKVKKIIHDKGNEIVTPECCLAELKGWCMRERRDFERAYLIIRSDSEIESIYTEDWLESAEIKHEVRRKIKDFGLIDSTIVAKQRRHGCTVLSGDKHFKTLKNVEYVGD